jgi:hypothetical protein
MRSSSRPASLRRFLQCLLIGALVILSRAPFLVHGDRFFDSDEAVEGLMARHVLTGEHPAFLWGQHYKGVPEVYMAAAMFRVAGSSVVALKSVTLVCFALFVCLQFVLVERLFSRAIAWLATVFLILGPPSLVLWSLSANAEVVMTMLAGTVMCLGIDIWRRSGSRAAFIVAGVAAGFGLWVHQYIVYYWVAIALTILHSLPQRRKVLEHLLSARELPAWLRAVTAVLAAAAVVYLVLGATAFLTGGFDTTPLGFSIGVHHPQKLWNIAAGLLLIATVVRILALSARQNGSGRSLPYAAALAFAIGYAPALAAYATGGGAPPIGRTDLSGIAAAFPVLLHQVAPIVFGLMSPTTASLGVPFSLAIAIVIAVAASFLTLREWPFTPFFHILILTTPILFLLSGAFLDAQSYRYLMPASGAVAVVLALGVWRTFRWSRVAGTVVVACLLALFGLGQRAWYRQLAPDAQSARILDCLERNNVKAAVADYWLSYKLTFLSGERIIVAPENGVDRYPAYSAYVHGQPDAIRIPATMDVSCTEGPFLSR